MSPRVVAYCDGSGSYAGSDAGIGVCVYVDGAHAIEWSGFIGQGTNNLAELRAIRRALYIVDAIATMGDAAVVRSDSQWSIDAIKRAGFYGGTKYAGAHERLIYAIAAQIQTSIAHVTLEWVKGHAGEMGNEIADWLAGDAVWRHRDANWIQQTRGRRRRPDEPKAPKKGRAA